MVADGRAAAIELLWERHGAATARRGPKPTLTVEAIAEAGIRLADAEGLAAVTMQRVADALGVTKMALYRYVPGKDELVALMIDIGVGEPPRLDGDWRARLEQWARELLGRFWGRQWALEATVGHRVIGPNEFGWLEAIVAALADTGLSGAEKFDAAAILSGHVRSIAQQSWAEFPESAMDATIAALLRGREDRFPSVAAAMKSIAEQGIQDDAFNFGLARILDGIEILIADR